MQTYSKWSPTAFDQPGHMLDEQQDWLVVPVGRSRDADLYAESNFEAALEMLGGEGEDVEVHRFGHWAAGWVEILIVRPFTAANATAEEIEESLENYPILDEGLHNEKVMEAEGEAWENWAEHDFRSAVEGAYGVDLDNVSPISLTPVFLDAAETANEYWIEEGSGVYIDIDRVVENGGIDVEELVKMGAVPDFQHPAWADAEDRVREFVSWRENQLREPLRPGWEQEVLEEAGGDYRNDNVLHAAMLRLGYF